MKHIVLMFMIYKYFDNHDYDDDTDADTDNDTGDDTDDDISILSCGLLTIINHYLIPS